MTIAATTKPTGKRWHELFLFAVMLVVVIGLKLPVLHTPYFWDEMGAYVEPSRWLSTQSLVHALPGLHPSEMFFGHPPALYALIALIFKLFGTASSGPHLLSICFAFLGLCYTYLIGKLLYDWQVGMAAAALLFAMPLYFAQAGMMLGDIPVAALGVMSVYYSLRRCYPAFLLAGFCLVLVKETGMALVAAVVVFQLLTDWKEKERGRTFLLAVPLVPLALFFAVQKLATGTLLPNPYFSANAFATFAPMSILLKGSEAIYTIFFVQFRFVLTLAVVAGLVVCRQKVFRRELLLFGLIAVFFAGAFTVIFPLPRYFLPVLPYLAITAAAALFALCRSTWQAWSATAVCLLLFLFAMHGNTLLMRALHGNSARGLSLETNMEYLNVVSTYRQAGEYLEHNFPRTPVYAAWPLSQAYGAPYLGYVSRPLQIAPSLETAQIAVFSEQSDLSKLVMLEGIIKQKNLRPLRVFERQGRSTAIYLLPAGVR